MKSARVAALVALVLLGCATEPPVPTPVVAPPPPTAPSPQAQLQAKAAVLVQQPVVGPLQPFAAPVPKTVTLPNGLTLIVVERKQAALSSIIFATKHGAVHDGVAAGLASITSEMLQAGSAGRSATQIAQEVTALGTGIDLNASREDLTAELDVIPEKLPEATKLLGEVMLAPNLLPAELERVRQERQSKLVAQLDDPHELSTEAISRTLFGESSYGRPLQGTKSTIAKLKLAEIKRYLGEVGGANSAVVVVGPLPLSEVQPLVEKAFGRLPAGQPEPATKAQAVTKRPESVLVDKPGAPQSVVRLVQPSIDAHSPDRYALQLANTVFGGAFTSRINQNLREVHGYTYGAGSRFRMMRGGGSFVAGADVKTEVTGASIHELQVELERMKAQGLSAAEVDKAKALFTAGLVDELQTTAGTARAIAGLWVDELPLDELAKQLPAVAKLTPDEVNAAWARAVDAKQLTAVIVGDAKSIEPQLQAQQLPKPVRMTPAK